MLVEEEAEVDSFSLSLRYLDHPIPGPPFLPSHLVLWRLHRPHLDGSESGV